jgi:uncharacterized membrane protein
VARVDWNVVSARGARIGFAIGVSGLGVLCLVYGDFALQWQSVPPWFPWPRGLAYVSGAFLLAAGIGLLFARTAARCALAVTAYQLMWLPVRGADVVPQITSIGGWYGFFQTLALLCGGWILWASLVRAGDPSHITRLDGERAMRVARILFGASCVLFGLAHFAYAEFTASFIPGWLPARLWLVYLTGACHVAAGLGILSSIFARLAATLEAIMVGAFVPLVHIPSLVVAPPPEWGPTPQIQWTELLLAWMVAASAAIVATSLPDANQSFLRGRRDEPPVAREDPPAHQPP